MCGIIGSINYSRKYKIGMEKTISELLFCDTLRGTDATGIYAVDKDLNIDWSKECINGWDFPVYNKRGRAILRNAEEHTYIIGHNRAATKGNASNVAYAHPIVIKDKLGLVHNGTLNMWPKDRGEGRIEHDSTSIAETIAEAGVQEFVDTHYGAYSLVWHDAEKNTLNFLRNDERPMAMMYSDDVIFFGSELGMLVWIAQRNSFRLVKHFYTEPMTLYTFEPGSAEPRMEKIVKNFSNPARQRFQGAGNYGNYSHSYPKRSGGTVVDFRRPNTSAESDSDDAGGITPELVRSRREAERLEEVTRLRNEAVNAEREARSQEEGSTDSGEGEGGRRRPRDLPRAGEKPKVKVTTIIQYKEFHVGTQIMFSAVDYGEVREHENGALYTITGEPHHPLEHPRVQIRSTVKVKDFPQEKLQHTNKYLWGKIQSMHETEMGNLIIWVNEIRESVVEDPNQQILRRASPKPPINTDEVAEAVVVTSQESPKRQVPALEKGGQGKEFCQGCNEFFDKTKLKQLFETWTNPATKRTNTNSFRFCADCLVTYACDRDKVVPAKARGIRPTNASIQNYH